MSKARRKIVLFVGLAAALLLVGAWALRPQPRFSRSVYEDIREGMTLKEVEALVGLPPGDYTGGRVRIFHAEVREGVNQGNLVGPSDYYQEWVGEEVAILIWLDDERRVARKECVETTHVVGSDGSFFRKLRRWLRW